MSAVPPPLTDATHHPALKSWVVSANAPGADFPIQNLPLARFRPRVEPDAPLRVGVAIGDQILDLRRALDGAPWPAEVEPLIALLAGGDLQGFAALGPEAWQRGRAAFSQALAEGSVQAPFLEDCLLPQADAVYALPMRIGDYSDFYAGIHHARAVGALFRPEQPLLPNYPWVPIGYHGRASSVGVFDQVRRPQGQLRSSEGAPRFGKSQRLDHELELGLWVGVANELGQPVSLDEAERRIFGITLLNDWSARDIQAWEYQPLGPFLAKSFATSVSPWVVGWAALAPFRRPFVRPEGDPQPLPYLDGAFNRAAGAIAMQLEVWLQTARMRQAGEAAVRISHSNALDAYWTPAQLLAHHASNGCNLQVGDLLGTGTLSGPGPGQGGSLLELSHGGKQPLSLPNGETRTFLEDGDRVLLRAWCEAPGAVRIGLGEVAATVVG